MRIKRFEFNMFPVNCYILSDETKEAVIIDAGCFYEEEKQALKKYIDDNGLNVKHLLNIFLQCLLLFFVKTACVDDNRFLCLVR